VSAEPGDDELAAIAAAYAIVQRVRMVTTATPPAVPRWRLAARVELDGAPAARVAGRRSAWRTATGP